MEQTITSYAFKQSLFYGTIYYQRNGTVEKPVVMLAQDCAGTNTPQSIADKKEKLMLRKLTAQSSSNLESRPLQSQCERLNGIESMQHIQPNPKIIYVPNIHKIRYGAYQLFLTPILQLLEMIYFCSFNNQNSICLVRCSAERAQASPFFFFFFCSLSLSFWCAQPNPTQTVIFQEEILC